MNVNVGLKMCVVSNIFPVELVEGTFSRNPKDHS